MGCCIYETQSLVFECFSQCTHQYSFSSTWISVAVSLTLSPQVLLFSFLVSTYISSLFHVHDSNLSSSVCILSAAAFLRLAL